MTTVLLHDTIGSMTEAELAGRFGAETARLAFAFADPPLAPGAPDTWRARREAYLRKLATVDDAALLVVACEELHELGDLLTISSTRGLRPENGRACTGWSSGGTTARFWRSRTAGSFPAPPPRS